MRARTARLEGSRGLYTLGMSLATACGERLEPAVFQRRCLIVEGRADPMALARFHPTPPWRPLAAIEVLVFAARAGMRHGVGREFDVLLAGDRSAEPARARCILVGVIGPDGTPRDEVPLGERTLCRLRFPSGMQKRLIKKTNTVNNVMLEC